MQAYGFDEESVMRIRETVRRVEGSPVGGGAGGRRQSYYTIGMIPALSFGPISAATSDSGVITFGKGQVKPYTLDGDTLVPEADAKKVCNLLTEAVPNNVVVHLYWFAGKLWVAGWEC